MEVKTFRAKTLPDALHLVRQEMGPDARVLSTKKNAPTLWDRLTGGHLVEVTALSREDLESPQMQSEASLVGNDANTTNALRRATPHIEAPSPADDLTGDHYRDRFRQFVAQQEEESLLESLIEKHRRDRSPRLPSTLFRLFTDMIDVDVDDRFAQELVEDLHRHSTPAELSDFDLVKAKAMRVLGNRIVTAPEIGSQKNERRVVALVGPTGVGKTTTIAKLAANLRLRDKRRVGLITVDTYRIAAVDQLRAYADIIDLPMEVVTTPREMRDAVQKLSELDIVLIDTAGRSPHDGLQLQELKSMLTEAKADEIQLVLSSVANARHLTRSVDHFRTIGPTALLLTKLDEAISYGHLLPILCTSDLPVSYTTHGQNVPDDIQPADPTRLIESILTT